MACHNCGNGTGGEYGNGHSEGNGDGGQWGGSWPHFPPPPDTGGGTPATHDPPDTTGAGGGEAQQVSGWTAILPIGVLFLAYYLRRD